VSHPAEIIQTIIYNAAWSSSAPRTVVTGGCLLHRGSSEFGMATSQHFTELTAVFGAVRGLYPLPIQRHVHHFQRLVSLAALMSHV
jgi:hypothetical protein